ncbi:patatin-like phospholipase family protein [Metabacillus arenae]|uniref:Patatin family protein n=1 Tax=Metabacillus arenae TaxID=2771434 RepID=A0A926NGJ6_9BACI|nr:patatin family protein [Metabacillus arenae]MBD1380400.1 patatin family protein [Metabacillus arenae]
MVQAGLVLEGGGMRGVYTAGVLEYFLENDLSFPYLIGVSAGACMAASYLSKQKGRNKKVNIELVSHPKYLSFNNYLRYRQLFGMDFLFDEIPNKIVPYDFEAFRNSGSSFVVGTTDIETGEPVYFNEWETSNDLLTAIRASSSLPFIAPVVEFKQRKLMDGGISDSVPLKKAEQDGYQKNVVILTKNSGFQKKKPSGSWVLKKAYKEYPKLIEVLLQRYEIYNATQEYLLEQERKGNVFIIRPSEQLRVGRIERNPKKLENLYQLGINDAKRIYINLQKWLKS